jgi:hypothetical protein
MSPLNVVALTSICKRTVTDRQLIAQMTVRLPFADAH